VSGMVQKKSKKRLFASRENAHPFGANRRAPTNVVQQFNKKKEPGGKQPRLGGVKPT